MAHHVEIVHVIDEKTVVDIESYQTEWSGGSDRSPGFYVVSHEDADADREGEHETVAGPYSRLDEAMAAAFARGFSKYR